MSTVNSDKQRHPAFESEQAFLLHAAECLNALKSALKDSRPIDAGSVHSSRALRSMKEQELEELSKDKTIAMGRIDTDEGESFHIGPRIVWDGKAPIVISWAARIAAPFYTATPSEPQGLTLRRRLQTEYEMLIGLQDDISLEIDGALTAEAPSEPALTDVLLSELQRERTGFLRQMAATIQQDQYLIITRPAEVPTVVQGAPGTGKTIVGLHRAALLLYRNRVDGLEPTVLIVGPNALFIRYVSYVLPSLGEEAVDQFAVNELGEIRTRRVDDPLVARVKGSPEMAIVIANSARDRIRPPADPLQFQAEGAKFEVSVKAVGDAITEALKDGLPLNVAREGFRRSLESIVTRARVDATRDLTRSPRTPIRRLPEFQRAMDRIWPFLTPPDLVRQLLTSEERLDRAGAPVLTEAQRRVLYRKPEPQGEAPTWTTSDVPLIDEAQSLLQGETRRYWHVVLDEAQDLTPMELRMVGRRLSGGAVTVLGDLAQATGGWNYDDWREVLKHLGIDIETPIQELRYGYRVPMNIMGCGQPILKLTAPRVAVPLSIRPGGAVAWIKVDGQGLADDAVAAARDASREGGTTAIIAPRDDLPALRSALEGSNVSYGDAENSDVLDTHIELLDPVKAKGLEFDHVVLVEPGDLIRDSASSQGYRELYVALTRATRSLTYVYSAALPWPLSEMSPSVGGPSSIASASDIETSRAQIAAELMRSGVSPTDAREYSLLVYPPT